MAAGTAFAGLLAGPDGETPERREAPDYFADLNLDQVVAALTDGREEYDLAPLLQAPLRDLPTIERRQETLRALERVELRGVVDAFAARMREVRRQLIQAGRLRFRYQAEAWFLAAARAYAAAVEAFARDLTGVDLDAPALRDFGAYLARYAASPEFRALRDEADAVARGLDAIRYTLTISGPHIKVADYRGEDDYGAEVAASFTRFRQGETRSFLTSFAEQVEMNHVEAAVLALVARLHPAEFAALDAFHARYADFRDATVVRFDREVQFFLADLDLGARLHEAGAVLCYPDVVLERSGVRARGVFDVALAVKLLGERGRVVRNDFELAGAERVLVVSGPNQGGKTTFARTFGQLHHLAALGLRVPAEDARLHLPDRILTHFERAEELTELRGKLEDDLLRMRDLLAVATGDSVVILNEIFTSTTLADALFLGTRVLERVIDVDALCVCVTFVDELSRLGPTVVSMTSMVEPDDPAIRTFKVVRRPADGLAHAMAIAEKYRLDYRHLAERIGA